MTESTSGLGSTLLGEGLLKPTKESNINIVFYVSTCVGGGMILAAITVLAYRLKSSRRGVAHKKGPPMVFNFAIPVPNGLTQSPRRSEPRTGGQSSNLVMLNQISGFQMNSQFGSQAMLTNAGIGRPLQTYHMPIRTMGANFPSNQRVEARYINSGLRGSDLVNLSKEDLNEYHNKLAPGVVFKYSGNK